MSEAKPEAFQSLDTGCKVQATALWAGRQRPGARGQSGEQEPRDPCIYFPVVLELLQSSSPKEIEYKTLPGWRESLLCSLCTGWNCCKRQRSTPSRCDHALFPHQPGVDNDAFPHSRSVAENLSDLLVVLLRFLDPA